MAIKRSDIRSTYDRMSFESGGFMADGSHSLFIEEGIDQDDLMDEMHHLTECLLAWKKEDRRSDERVLLVAVCTAFMMGWFSHRIARDQQEA